jgi:spermidine synthase
VSLGVLLATFMGGMCLGSLLLPRMVSARRHPLRVYAVIELGIGAAGLVILFALPSIDHVYVAYVRPGLASILLRAAVCAVCLLPPTVLMGATLPAIARWVEATPRGIAWLGFFYGGNIAGAVFGCLLAGFYLLRLYDTTVATYVAAALNLTVAAMALLLAHKTTYLPPQTDRVGWRRRADRGTPEPRWAQPTPHAVRAPGAGIIYVVIALSGLTALGAEVVWTRNLSLLLGGTVYTFSIILAVFLVGLGLGSGLGSVILRHSLRPRAALGVCQLLLMGAIAWTAYTLADSLPHWPIDPALSRNPWISFQLDLVRCAWAVLPAAILWGASFPLALAAVAGSGRARASGPTGVAVVNAEPEPLPGQRGDGDTIDRQDAHAAQRAAPGDATLPMVVNHRRDAHAAEPPDEAARHEPGRLVGGVYAANTVGAILGSLGFSMILIPWLGTRGSQRAMIALAALNVLLLLPAAVLSRWASRGRLTRGGPRKPVEGPELAGGFDPQPSPGPGDLAPACAPENVRRYEAEMAGRQLWPSYLLLFFASVAVSILAVLLLWSVPPVPPGLIAYGRYLAVQSRVAEAIYVGEGMNSTVAVTLLDDEVVSFHVCGKVEASTEPADMRLQRMLGHLSALLHPKPQSILVVGCGAGVTAGAFVLHPDVERIVLCEIEPLIPQVAAGFFARENYNFLHDPRVEVVYDDARHYILTTRENFDVITSDPIHPWIKGSAALYTKEYFELCRRHLKPGGIVTQWVPLYESDADVVKSEMATFFAAFPQGTIWSNDIDGQGYDVVLLGSIEPMPINFDRLQERLERADHLEVVRSLAEVKFNSALDLLLTYAGRGPDLQDWLQGAQINTDRNLRLQYLAGLGLNANQGEAIYNDILSYRTFPDDLFVGTPARRLLLRAALAQPASNP